MATAAELQAKITKLETNMDRFNLMINGGNTVDVTTDNGPVPSWAKVIATILANNLILGYPTVEDLPAVSANAVALVTNDTNADNNGLWVSDGTTWNKALTTSEEIIFELLRELESRFSVIPLNEDLVMAWIDGDGRILGGFTETGEFRAQMEGDARFAAGQSDYAWAVLGSDGRVLLGIDRDGSITSAPNSPKTINHISGGAVIAVEPDGTEVTATPAGRTALSVEGEYATLNLASIGSKTVAKITTDGSGLWSHHPDIIPVFIGEGQSLEAGSRSTNPDDLKAVTAKNAFMLSTGHPDRTNDVRVGLNAGTSLSAGILQPWFVNGFTKYESVISPTGYGGQAPLDGFVQTFSDKLNEAGLENPQLVSFTLARGGQAYTYPPADSTDGLAPGTQAWDNQSHGITRAIHTANRIGKKAFFPMIFMEHGQSDAAGAGYEDDLLHWHTERTNYIMSAAGQSYRPKFAMTQTSSFVASLSDNGAHVDQRLFCKTYPDKGIITCPEYPMYWDHAAHFDTNPGDWVHMLSAGYWKIGEYRWKAYRDDYLLGKAWKGVDVREISYVESSTTLSVRFWVPVGPLVLDTTFWSAPASTCYGFAVEHDDGGPGQIVVPTTASVRDSEWVDFTLSAPLPAAPANRWLRAGLNGHAAERAQSTIPRTCLRDSDPMVSSYDGGQLYNWCLHSRETF